MYLTSGNSLEHRFFGVSQILFVDAIVILLGDSVSWEVDSKTAILNYNKII